MAQERPVIFDRLRAWIIGVLNKMISQATIKEAIGIDVAISDAMIEALRLWGQMYGNESPWVNGETVKSLNLAAVISSEIARAVTIEMKVEVTGSPRADYLMEQLSLQLPKMRQMVEFGAAKGGLIMKPYVTEDRIMVDFVQADQFFPVVFDTSGNITSCVFSDQRTIGKKFYTRLEMHEMTKAGCRVVNKAFVSDARDSIGRPVPLTDVDVWADIEPEATIEGVDKPLFSYFRYPMANTIDPSCPLGVACYSRATDMIKEADILWSNLLWEFDSGQRALYIDVLAFGKDKDGKPILPNKRLYKAIESNSIEKEFFEDWSPDFREVSILSGLDAILRKVEFSSGLAYGTISDPNSIEKTATEIVSSKQRSYATITDTQKALQGAMENLIKSMDIWATIEGLAPKGKYDTKFEFDDSVVIDKEMQMASDMRMVTAAIMSKVEFRMRNLGEDEATAKKQIALATAEQPADPYAEGGSRFGA
jgi:A118 family predicted phage portal protein